MSNLLQLKLIKEQHYTLSKILNVQFDEIYAFGDGGNDVEQFKIASTAVAMANAPDVVQKKADVITKTNDENGFTYAVNELLKI